MTIRRSGAGATVVALTGLALFGMQASASAAPGGQPGKPPKCPKSSHYAPGGPGNQCRPNGIKFQGEDYTFCPGESATFTVTAYRPGTGAKGFVAGRKQPVGQYTADPQNGRVDGSFPVPGKPGIYQFVVNGTASNGQPTSISRQFRVVKCASSKPASSTTVAATKASFDAPASTVASTSSLELGALAGAGALLLGTGPALALRSRRRKA